MGQIVANDTKPTDYGDSDIPEVTGESADVTTKEKLEVKTTTSSSDNEDNGNQNMLIIGGLLALLFLFRKKL
jgi:hypothetical protein